MPTDWDHVPFPELDESQLRVIAERHALPPRGWRRLPSPGVINSVYAIDGTCVLRVPKNMDEGLSDTYTESVAAPVAFSAGVATPKLLVFDDDRDIVDVPFSVYAWSDGTPLDSATSLDTWAAVGEQLALLHTRVDVCPDPLGLLDDAGHISEHRARVWADEQPPDTARLATAWLDRLASAFEAGGADRFLHNDIQDGNVLAVDGALSSIIDWGDAAWGDPALEFTYVPLHAVPTTLAAYRAVAPIDDAAAGRALWDKLVRAFRSPGLVHALRAACGHDELWKPWLPT